MPEVSTPLVVLTTAPAEDPPAEVSAEKPTNAGRATEPLTMRACAVTV
jgi:hypothetical protein